MLGISDYWAFVAAVLVFLALPGPGTFALLNATAKGGFRAGAAATLGLIGGDQVLMWLAAVGVAAVLQANEALFKGLQYAGAAYLAWIGLKLLFGGAGTGQPVNLRPGHFARQAFFITLMNPKAIVFYMAFFPLFIDAGQHRGFATFAAMALTIAVVTLAYCLTLCAFAGAVSERVRAHRRLSLLLQRAAGLALIGFGLKLAR
ncbi:MAG: LysE family transporter [Betaproteobacteria bacterium]